MKKVALLLAGVVLGLGLRAQIHDEAPIKNKLFTQAVNEQNELQFVTAFNTSAAHKTSTATMMQLDSILGTGPYAERIIFNYDSIGTLLQYLFYDWDVNSWMPDYREDYEYDNQNRLSVRTEYIWTPNWTQHYKQTYSYDPVSGLLDEILREKWSVSNQIWEMKRKTTYDYNMQGLLELEEAYNWDNNVWENAWKNEYTYNTIGQVTERLYSYWNGAVWSYNSKDSYTYNSQSLLEERINFYYNSSNVWEESDKYEYSYYAGGKIKKEAYFGWNGQWDPYGKNEWYYTSADDIDYQTWSSYNSSTSQFEFSEKIECEHDLSYTFEDLILPWSFLEEGGEEYFTHKLDSYKQSTYVSGNWQLEVDVDLFYSAYSGIGVPELSTTSCIVYPNPTEDWVEVLSDNTTIKCSFKLFDNYGRLIHSVQFQNHIRINISDLPAGIYMWRLQQENSEFEKHGKLLKK